MKLMLASIYTNFDTTLTEDDGMEQLDNLYGAPVSGKLILEIRRVDKA
jgi:hypothetical protein